MRGSSNRADARARASTFPPLVPARLIREPAGAASEAIGTLVPGCRVVGITKGQFSLLDLLRACLDQTGPADVLVSTWTTGIRDAETAAWLLRSGEIRSLQFLTDRSFPTRQPAYALRLVELFGEDAVVCTKTHAKFALIRNERWDLCIRSSMNLNRNPRFEQFDLDDSAEICDFFAAFADEVRTRMRVGIDITNTEVDRAFDAVMVADAPAEPERDVLQGSRLGTGDALERARLR